MPELPDLQVFSKNLNKILDGKTIKGIKVLNKKKLNVPDTSLQDALVNAKIKAVEMDGKELRTVMNNGNVLGIYLMLHGQMSLFENEDDHQPQTILSVYFDNGKILSLTDYQGLATITLNPEVNTIPDALSKELTFGYFEGKLKSVRGAIKNVLLDQKILRGIGNAYADEILWDARIAPGSTANKLPADKIKVLLKSVKKVLKDAEMQILSSNPEIISGEVRGFLLIHNAKNTHSPSGSVIKQTTSGSRKTYYTEEQELFK